MTTKVKVSAGWLNKRLPIVIEHHRLKRTYGWKLVVIKKGWWKKEYIDCPISDCDEYWEIMRSFYPWNCLIDCKHILKNAPDNTILYVDAALPNAIMEVTGDGDE